MQGKFQSTRLRYLAREFSLFHASRLADLRQAASDLLVRPAICNAFNQANRAGLLPGQLGATYFIPVFIVPLLLITHGLTFRIVLEQQSVSAVRENRRLA